MKLIARVGVAAFAALLQVPLVSAAVYPGAVAPVVSIQQRLGARLPLDARFVDSNGHAVRLGDYFRAETAHEAVPVVLVLGYYRCPNLCETVMEGALQALAESGLPRRSFRVLAVSIDPGETPADARSRRRVDQQVADAAWRADSSTRPNDALRLDALVGDAGSIAALAQQAGFVFSRSAAPEDDAGRAAFAHAAGFLIATPDGRVSRYFLGVRHDPAALRSAVDAAAGRSIGGLVDDLLLLCAHLDPTLGRHTPGVMLALRLGSLALAAGLGLWIWRHRRTPPSSARPLNDTSDAGFTSSFHLLADSASTVAAGSDRLFLAMLVLCGLVAIAVTGCVAWFCIRYRSGASVDRSHPPSGARRLELAWTIAPLVIFMAVFAWAAHAFVDMHRSAADALPVYVVGKQWMWTLQHRNGRREIDELHVPLGQPVRLVMTSQDVIHSFFVPAFRLKQDVVPGRYTTLSFTASQLGDFHLFCSEYCGTAHPAMLGRVVVMEPAAFARWLDAGPGVPGLAQQGFALFREHGCSGCHAAGSTVRAPLLDGLIGSTVHLQDGRSLVADENYVRDSILAPGKDVVAGFAPAMPSYAGQLSEEQIEALVAYLRSTGEAKGMAK